MLIRVNETTWIHADDVKKINITHTKIHGKSRSSVNIETYNGDEFFSSFSNKAAAVDEANRLAEIINLAKAETP